MIIKKQNVIRTLTLAVLVLASLACSATTRPQTGAILPVTGTPTDTPYMTPRESLRLTETPPVTITPPALCTVSSGYTAGTVNLRACAGVGCAVVAVLTEGDPLTVITPGEWAQVQTADGLTGYVNAKYCK